MLIESKVASLTATARALNTTPKPAVHHPPSRRMRLP